MFAVYVASTSGVGDWLGLMLALAFVGGLGAFCGPRARRLLVWLVVAGVMAYGAHVAYAVPYPCPWEWRWLGIC